MDSYDEIPYHSAPFAETHPINLAVIGRLFGLETPDPDRCRVLELGCASGGNLIPVAWHLPGAQFEGIELSATQAAGGASLAAELGLANVRIRQADILEPGTELGEFDFILAHGVYSWVPEEVQERILALCAEHLSPTGVAYVSYNTLPGWRMRGMLRDVLLHHVRGAEAPAQRLARAREVLERLDTALAGLEALSARYLRQEIAYLRGAHPSYLYHEYLESRNEPLLLTEFVRRAAGHGLQYLGDTDLAGMFPASAGDGAGPLLEGIEDQVELEQYLDFVRNRNFRQTLLCRAGHELTREIDLEVLDRLAVFSALEPPRKVDLRSTKPAPFRKADGKTFPVHHPLTRAALLVLERAYPDSLPLPALREEAARQVSAAGAGHLAAQTEHLAGELFSLYAHAAVGFDTRPRSWPRGSLERPRATLLARAQAARGLGHLATPRHGTLTLDPFAVRLVAGLDGTSDRDELVDGLTTEIREGGLDLGLPAPLAPDRLRGQVAANVDRLTRLFAHQGVLEAPGS
jgi:methyltransferase-like protein/2-polyprenyl-3-methyl-5-hydroxy-6-metoxy-1,4-benzoquinol methylase